MTYVHCPECSFQNPEAAKFCSKCGALLIRDEAASDTTLTFVPEEMAEEAVQLADLRIEGTALVVRAGGGRAGETFAIELERMTIGRSPECDVFLDDVTVSRSHAVITKAVDGWLIEDQGSLNGTYVNRRRVDAAVLEDGDDVQIGKYRLTFLEH